MGGGQAKRTRGRMWAGVHPRRDRAGAAHAWARQAATRARVAYKGGEQPAGAGFT